MQDAAELHHGKCRITETKSEDGSIFNVSLMNPDLHDRSVSAVCVALFHRLEVCLLAWFDLK